MYIQIFAYIRDVASCRRHRSSQFCKVSQLLHVLQYFLQLWISKAILDIQKQLLDVLFCRIQAQLHLYPRPYRMIVTYLSIVNSHTNLIEAS